MKKYIIIAAVFTAAQKVTGTLPSLPVKTGQGNMDGVLFIAPFPAEQCLNGDICGLDFRKMVHPGGDGRERNGADVGGFCQLHAVPIAPFQKGVVVHPVDGTNGVEHISGREPVALCQLGFAGLAPTQTPALRQQLRASRPVNGAVNPATAQKGLVGGVDDAVYLQFGDILIRHRKADPGKFCFVLATHNVTSKI